MKTSTEFVVGKHGIGYIDSDFHKRIEDKEFEARPMPNFQKLPRYMDDAAIEAELKPGICELGDIVAFMGGAPEECKDGNWNLFYLPNFVVGVIWLADDRGWSVDAWYRVDDDWGGDDRVFSPAAASLGAVPSALESSGTSAQIRNVRSTLITINFVENGYLIENLFSDGPTKQHVASTAEEVRDVIYQIVPKG